MLDFTAIYLDSQPLIAAGWPRLSSRLGSVVSLSQIHNIPVFIPEPVEIELEEHWLRDFQERRLAVTNSLDKLNKYCHEFVPDVPVPTIQDSLALRSTYRAKAAAMKQLMSIKSSPATKRLLSEVFNMSCSRATPFDKAKDTAFQDVVIYLSVLDHLRDNSVKTVAFVSQDKIFENTGGLEQSAGVKVILFKTLEDIEKRFKDELIDRMKVQWEKDRQNAEGRFSAMLPDIAEFVADNLDLPADEAGLFTKIETLQNAQAIKIIWVSTPAPFGRKDGDDVNISADLEMKLTVLVDRSVSCLLGSLLVEKDAARGPKPSPPDFTPTSAVEELTRNVELEALATYKDGEFLNIRLQRVRLKKPNLGFGAFSQPTTRDRIAERLEQK